MLAPYMWGGGPHMGRAAFCMTCCSPGALKPDYHLLGTYWCNTLGVSGTWTCLWSCSGSRLLFSTWIYFVLSDSLIGVLSHRWLTWSGTSPPFPAPCSSLFCSVLLLTKTWTSSRPENKPGQAVLADSVLPSLNAGLSSSARIRSPTGFEAWAQTSLCCFISGS